MATSLSLKPARTNRSMYIPSILSDSSMTVDDDDAIDARAARALKKMDILTVVCWVFNVYV